MAVGSRQESAIEESAGLLDVVTLSPPYKTRTRIGSQLA